MTEDHAEAIALHRWAVIAEAANPKAQPGGAGGGGARERRAGPRPP